MKSAVAEAIIKEKTLGILGGGQLGKMLLQVTNRWGLSTAVLDGDNDCPAKFNTHKFVWGSYKDYQTVYDFGKNVDFITVETEHVNTEALIKLRDEGKTIHPDPDKLKIIQDKGLQKEFYRTHNLPSSSFVLTESKSELLKLISEEKIKTPFVQKLRKGGYDGKGVVLINNNNDLEKIIDAPSVIEEPIAIEKELAVIVCRNENGEVKAFEPVEMYFNEHANMLDFQLCPAQINDTIKEKAIAVAIATAHAFNISGLLAIELFLDKSGAILINECAPRPHNSGHHTIETCITSQFEQHLRGVLNLPLGATQQHTAAAMINLVGEPNFEGAVMYQGMHNALKEEGLYIHLYGKKHTKPFRKMGHLTVTGKDSEEVKAKAFKFKNIIKVIA